MTQVQRPRRAIGRARLGDMVGLLEYGSLRPVGWDEADEMLAQSLRSARQPEMIAPDYAPSFSGDLSGFIGGLLGDSREGYRTGTDVVNALGFTGAGTPIDARDAVQAYKSGDTLNAAILGTAAGVGAIPGVGRPISKAVKSVGKSVSGILGDVITPSSISLADVLEARAKQMDLPVDKRIEPDPSLPRVIDTDFREGAPWTNADDMSGLYPRFVSGAKQLGKNDRMRPFVENREEIADRIAEQIKGAGYLDTPVQYFYHSSGPLYRAAVKSGLSPDEAQAYVRDFSSRYAATSPRTNTTANARNATLAMVKEAEGIPHTTVVGPGTIDAKTGKRGISERGYPMMIGKGGIHGKNLEAVEGKGFDMMTNPKPTNFDQNVYGNLGSVTADTHAIRGAAMAMNDITPGSLPEAMFVKTIKGKPTNFFEKYKEDPSVLTPDMIDDTLASAKITKDDKRIDAQVEYGAIADIYHSVAEKLGVSPAEAQSLAWFSLGDRTNLGSSIQTVADIMDDRINVTAQALGVSPEEVAKMVFRRQIPVMGLGGAVGLGLLGTQSLDRDTSGPGA